MEFPAPRKPNRRIIAEIPAYLADRRWRAAAEAFQRVLDESPQQPDATLGLAKALLARGQGVAAERRKNSRLSCQLIVKEELAGHTIETPERQ